MNQQKRLMERFCSPILSVGKSEKSKVEGMQFGSAKRTIAVNRAGSICFRAILAQPLSVPKRHNSQTECNVDVPPLLTTNFRRILLGLYSFMMFTLRSASRACMHERKSCHV